VLAVVAYNPLSASLRQRAIDLENQLFPRASASKEEVVWLGQRSETGNGVIRAGAVLDGGKALTDATFFLFHADGRFRERVSAERADLVGLQWRLSGVRVFPADAPPFQEETRTIATNLRPDYIRRTYTSPESVSFWRLRAEAVESEAMGLDGTRYTLQFQRLLSQPLLLIAMVIIASTVSLRFFRMGGVAKGVALGIAAGFVLYIVKKLVEDLGSVGMLDTAFAAWFPAAVACLAGSTVLLHLEDG
jgi:lipopolysaccharide export system permease protein